MSRELAIRFSNIIHEMKKISLAQLRAGELTHSEMMLMFHVGDLIRTEGRATTAMLSSRLHISKPATSQAINLLEERQLLRRTIASDDRRVVVVTLTETGDATLKAEFDKWLDWVSQVLDGMGPEDGEQFVALLGKYVKSIRENMHA